MIGFIIFTLIYLVFTLGLATLMGQIYESWWKGLGVILIIEFGVCALFVLLRVAGVLVEKGI